jgi:hypothetical protein
LKVEDVGAVGSAGGCAGGRGLGLLAGEHARLADEREDVALDGGGSVDGVDLFAQAEQLLAGGDGLELGLDGDGAPAVEHRALLGGGGIVDEELEEEAVGLRLGERYTCLPARWGSASP